jgi:hypothetical protein
MLGRIEAAHVEKAVKWARMQVDSSLIDEYSIGPTTLEDAYLRLIGRQDAVLETEKEGSNVLSTSMA